MHAKGKHPDSSNIKYPLVSFSLRGCSILKDTAVLESLTFALSDQDGSCSLSETPVKWDCAPYVRFSEKKGKQVYTGAAGITTCCFSCVRERAHLSLQCIFKGTVDSCLFPSCTKSIIPFCVLSINKVVT